MTATLTLSTCTNGDPGEVRSLLAEILEGLSALWIRADDREAIEIVLAEVLNNIVEHAYGRSGKGPIAIGCHAKGGRLDISITDEGRSMPRNCLTPLQKPQAEDLPPENGFGWTLIHALTDEVIYRRSEDRNHLELRLPLHRSGFVPLA